MHESCRPMRVQKFSAGDVFGVRFCIVSKMDQALCIKPCGMPHSGPPGLGGFHNGINKGAAITPTTKT